jgi:hypothetical protein
MNMEVKGPESETWIMKLYDSNYIQYTVTMGFEIIASNLHDGSCTGPLISDEGGSNLNTKKHHEEVRMKNGR